MQVWYNKTQKIKPESVRIKGTDMVRLKDIALRTGLTVSTVSKALNHSKEISGETSRLIWETAREMGYVSKKAAKRAEKTIGVILPEVESQYYARLMHALNQKIENCGYVMITMLTSEYAASVGPVVERMCKYEPDGIIVCCGALVLDSDLQTILECGIPSVVMNEAVFSFPMDSIYIEVEQSVRLALDHLIQLGHKKIGYLGEYNSDTRYRVFQDLMQQNGLEIDPRFVKRGAIRFEEGGYQLACELMKEEELPTAIVGSYDQVAIGAIRAFQEHGIKVPRDISVVGFDNNVMDDYCQVALTSVTNPVEQMGITAVKILLDAIRHPGTHVIQNVSLQSRLIVRESTRAMCEES